jgi:hypothetical protein
VSALAVILMLVLVGAVVLVVGGPLRRQRLGAPGARPGRVSISDQGPAQPVVLERDELEAEREAKYREIRDTDLDYRTGKLSREDFEAVDGELRAEAIEILNRLQEADGRRERASEDWRQQAGD